MGLGKDTKTDIERIIEEIRNELKKRKSKDNIYSMQFESLVTKKQPCQDYLNIPKLEHTSPIFDMPFEPNEKDEYDISDLIKFMDNSEFVRNAYRAIHKTHVDEAVSENLLKKLAKGVSRNYILGVMRFSKNGRKNKVFIKGILPSFAIHTIYRVPFLGYILKMFAIIFRLPEILKVINKNEIENIRRHNKIIEIINNNSNQLNNSLETLQKHYNQFFEDMNNKTSRYDIGFNHIPKDFAERDEWLGNLEISLDDVKKGTQERDTWLSNLEKNLVNLQSVADKSKDELVAHKEWLESFGKSIKSVKKGLFERKEWLEGTAESIKKLNKGLGERDDWLNKMEKQKADKKDLIKIETNIHDNRMNILEYSHELKAISDNKFEYIKTTPKAKQLSKKSIKRETMIFNALYASLEERFRGNRKDIKELLKIYLPYLKDNKLGTSKKPILDIGCGRGEWLELCKENGLTALGADNNPVMILQCKEFDLNVIEEDAYEYLKKQKPNSIGAITGFHFIEHLSFNERVLFIDEVLRTLIPGGIVIFETPNPENLTVGAYKFYLDPTHCQPIVPDTMQFILEQRGFKNAQIIRLHKNTKYYESKIDNDFKNEYFYCEMDYSVIAFK